MFFMIEKYIVYYIPHSEKTMVLDYYEKIFCKMYNSTFLQAKVQVEKSCTDLTPKYEDMVIITGGQRHNRENILLRHLIKKYLDKINFSCYNLIVQGSSCKVLSCFFIFYGMEGNCYGKERYDK